MTMSNQQATLSGAPSGKKAVHVKWAGKTIALGTFPSSEADEKCQRAKALTRAWRSTMRPKPTREWVMGELERLGVRVVSGRLGRKAGEEDEAIEKKSTAAPLSAQVSRPPPAPTPSAGWSSTSELDHIMQQRRNSSLGLSMMSDREINRRGSLGSLGPILGLGLDTGDPIAPAHRPLVGGGSAAAYEAARADHYAQKRESQVRRASSLGLGMSANSVQMSGLSVNPNQHYEMLKLHHMNLLNEIQETTLMMNLYQQQQLQQQQQHLQQRQASALPDFGGNDILSMSKRASLGLGGGASASATTSAVEPKQKKTKPHSSVSKSTSHKKSEKAQKMKPKDEKSHKKALKTESEFSESKTEDKADLEAELLKSQREQEALEAKLKKIKADIALREKEAEELQKKAEEAAVAAANKRKAEESKATSEPALKKQKADEDNGIGREKEEGSDSSE